jgi:PAS domain S-box-containing protein
LKNHPLKKNLPDASALQSNSESTKDLRGLLAGFGMVALLVAAISVYGVISSRLIQQDFDKIVNGHNQHMDLLRQMELAVLQRTRLNYEILNLNDAFELDEKTQEFSAAGSKFMLSLQTLKGMQLTEEEHLLLAQLAAASTAAQLQLNKKIDLLVSGKQSATKQHLLNQVFLAQSGVLSLISKLIAYNQAEVSHIQHSALIKSQQQQRVLIIGGGLSILLALGIGWRVWWRISKLTTGLQSKQQALEVTLRTMSFQKIAMDEHAIVSIADPAGRILSVNKKFCDVSQYSEAELIGQNHRILNSAYHPHKFFIDMWCTIAGGKVWHGNIRNKRKDGSHYWVSSTIVPFLNNEGKPYQYVSMRTDISQLIEAEQQLTDQASHTRAIMDNMSGGVVTIDENGIITSFNLAATTIFGYANNEAVGRNVSMLMPNPHRDAHDAYLRAYRNTGVRHVIGKHMELEALRKDGSPFPIDLVVSEITHNNRPTYVGLIQDITERKRAERVLIAARDEANRANAAKSAFLSSMSHELRTPMNAILGFSQLMSFDSTLSDENKNYVEEILKAGDHLLKLINEVLDLSRIESGTLELTIAPVQLCDIIGECLDLVATLANQRSIDINHNTLAGVIVLADSTRLKQALLNLLSNAIKYNREGGSITLSAIPQENNRLRILVTDTGPGIPAERMQELFQPFSRLGAENGTIEGTGIGLTITRRVIEMMGGQVDAISEIGVGSTFWIDLPRGDMHADNPELKTKPN